MTTPDEVKAAMEFDAIPWLNRMGDAYTHMAEGLPIASVECDRAGQNSHNCKMIALQLRTLTRQNEAYREAMEKISRFDTDRQPGCEHCCSVVARKALAEGAK